MDLSVTCSLIILYTVCTNFNSCHINEHFIGLHLILRSYSYSISIHQTVNGYPLGNLNISSMENNVIRGPSHVHLMKGAVTLYRKFLSIIGGMILYLVWCIILIFLFTSLPISPEHPAVVKIHRCSSY